MRINNKVQSFFVLCLLSCTIILGCKNIQAQRNADLGTQATITIVEPLQMIFDSIVVTPLFCYGNTDAGLIVYVSGGTPPYTYTLLPPGATNMTGAFGNLGAGVYIIMVEDASGAPPIFSDTVIIVNPPEIHLDSLVIEHIGCNNQGNGAISVYGDGGTGTLTYTLNPGGIVNTSGIFTGLVAGTYSVIIEDDYGCVNDTTIAVEGYPNPIANYSDSSTCNYNVYFTDLSIANSASLVAWSWSFGDGGTSTLQNPVHTYASAGTYNVCLTVTNSNGCIDSSCSSVTILSAPISEFTYVSDSNLTISFIDMSVVDPGDTIIFWFWDFGDGGTSFLQNPVYTYAMPGNYTVSLEVMCMCGATDTMEQEVLVEDHAGLKVNISNDPLFNIYPNPFKEGISISFNLAHPSRVNIEVINTSGKIMASITNEQYPAGEHQLRWNGKGQAAGIYIVKMEAGRKVHTTKIIKSP